MIMDLGWTVTAFVFNVTVRGFRDPLPNIRQAKLFCNRTQFKTPWTRVSPFLSSLPLETCQKPLTAEYWMYSFSHELLELQFLKSENMMAS